MKKHFIRVVTVPLRAPNGKDCEGRGSELGEPEGEHPEQLAKRCIATAEYVVDIRLPSALKGLKVWVEPRIRPGESEYILDLLLFYSGQLPLQFRAPRGKGIHAGLLEEMDRLAACIEKALDRSNDIWSLGAEIINTEVDPADEIESVRVVSGYAVPNRGRRSKVPEILQLMGRNDPLPLFTPNIRPEYVESGELNITSTPSMNSDRLRLRVDEVRALDATRPFSTRVRETARLAPRWPDADPRPWILLAWLSKFMKTPMTTRGHAVISIDTLHAKAFEVKGSDNASQILLQLIDFLKPVLESQSPAVESEKTISQPRNGEAEVQK